MLKNYIEKNKTYPKGLALLTYSFLGKHTPSSVLWARCTGSSPKHRDLRNFRDFSCRYDRTTSITDFKKQIALNLHFLVDDVIWKMAMKQKASSESGSPRERGGSGLVTDHHPTALQVERLQGDRWPMDMKLPEEKGAPETAKLSSPVQVLTPNRMSSSLGKTYCPDAGWRHQEKPNPSQTANPLHHLIPTRMTIIKKEKKKSQIVTSVTGKHVSHWNPHTLQGGNAKWRSHCGELSASPSKR